MYEKGEVFMVGCVHFCLVRLEDKVCRDEEGIYSTPQYKCVEHPLRRDVSYCGETLTPYCFSGTLNEGNYRTLKGYKNYLELYEHESYSPLRWIT
jgi:hypothetical protein